MNTPNPGDRAQNPTTAIAACHQALDDALAQIIKLTDGFDLYLSKREDITPLDCSMVIEEAEKLIASLQTLKQAVKDRANVQGGAQ